MIILLKNFCMQCLKNVYNFLGVFVLGRGLFVLLCARYMEEQDFNSHFGNG